MEMKGQHHALAWPLELKERTPYQLNWRLCGAQEPVQMFWKGEILF